MKNSAIEPRNGLTSNEWILGAYERYRNRLIKRII